VNPTPPRPEWRRRLLAALLGSCAAWSAAAPAAEPSTSIRDVIDAPHAAWTRFLSEPGYADAYDAFDLLSAIGYTLDQVDADACRDRRGALDEAVLLAPVSIAMQRARMLCAEALGDEAAAEESMLAVASLSKLALADGRPDIWPRPIRVVAPADVYALLAAGGLEYRYEYHPQLAPQRHFPLVVAAWDEALGKERHLTFDYVDTANALVRGDPFSGYPVQRAQLVDGFLAAQAARQDIQAIDLQAVRAYRLAGSMQEKLAAVRPAAESGGVQALSTWLLACARERVDGCDDGLVDALLPKAEQEYAIYTVLLALAHATGVGVDRDEDAAVVLLDAADRRWQDDGATVMFARTWLLLSRPVPEFLRARMAAVAARGNLAIPVVTAAARLADGDESVVLDEAEVRALSNPANNGLGKGYALLAGYYHDRKQPLASNGWLKSASDAGDGDSQASVGMGMYRQATTDAQREAALALVASGAHGGSAMGMRFMAMHATDLEDWRAAEGWLLAAASAGNVAALLDLAGIYEWDRPGVHGKPADARATYEELSREVDSAEARRRLAGMALEGRGMEKDPALAERWLLQDAEKGDGESAVRLGHAFLAGDFGAADKARGYRWMQRAIDDGNVEAYSSYGSWYFYREGNTLEARRKGIELWRLGAEAGDGWSRNNLAWALCTAPEAELFDAEQGLAQAQRILAADHVPLAMRDTAASCHAASGDFQRAVALQREAVDGLTALQRERDRAEKDGMAARLALYEAGQRYVELHRDPDSAPD